MRTGFRTEGDRLRSAALPYGPVCAFYIGVVVGGLAILMTAHDALGFGASLSSVMPALLLYLGAAGVVAYGLQHHYPHDQLGLCNVVTLTRMVIVAVLAVAMFEEIPPSLTLLGLAILALCLDGVDGYLARRQGLISPFGARFDIEVDAAFALTLAVYAAVTKVAAPYVVLLGLPYYAFTLARRFWPWLDAPLPDSLARKAVCVAQISVLIAILVPWIPAALLNAAVLAVICALVWSFGRDILWLSRRRLP